MTCLPTLTQGSRKGWWHMVWNQPLNLFFLQSIQAVWPTVMIDSSKQGIWLGGVHHFSWGFGEDLDAEENVKMWQVARDLLTQQAALMHNKADGIAFVGFCDSAILCLVDGEKKKRFLCLDVDLVVGRSRGKMVLRRPFGASDWILPPELMDIRQLPCSVPEDGWIWSLGMLLGEGEGKEMQGDPRWLAFVDRMVTQRKVLFL